MLPSDEARGVSEDGVDASAAPPERDPLTSSVIIDMQDRESLCQLARAAEKRITESAVRVTESGGKRTPSQIRVLKRVLKGLKQVTDGHAVGRTAAVTIGEAFALAEHLTDATESLVAQKSLGPSGPSEVVPEERVDVLAAALIAEMRRSRSPSSLAELPSRHLREIADRQELIIRMGSGASAKTAAKDLPSGRTRSARWARRIAKEYREHGVQALTDGRRRNGRTPIISDRVILSTLVTYLTRTKAAPRAIRDHLMLTLPEHEIVPSCEWIRDLIARLPRHLRDIRNFGKEGWRKRTAPRGRMERTSYANELAESDHCTLDIWVREEVGPGEWKAVQPYLTGVIDVHSRAVLGILLSAHVPNGWSVALALRAAIAPKSDPRWIMHGKMDTLRLDNGKDFASEDIATSMRALGILLHFCHAHAPNEKPYIERWFLTVQLALLPRLPGYKGEGMKSQEAAQKRVHTLLTLDSLRNAVTEWILECYHKDEHGGLSQQFADPRPIAVWQDTARVRPIVARDLDILLLKTRSRRVSRQGLQLHGRLYACAQLADRVGEDVIIRYHPEEWDVIIVYADGSGYEPVVAYWVDAPDPQYTTAEHAGQRSRIGKVASQAMDWAHRHEAVVVNAERERDAVAGIAQALIGTGQRRDTPPLLRGASTAPAMPTSAEDAKISTEDELLMQDFLQRLAAPSVETTIAREREKPI